jgi:hypothetical protein
VLKKQKFEDLQTEIYVDVEGYMGHPKLMVLTILTLWFNLASFPVRKLHYKNFYRAFSERLNC